MHKNLQSNVLWTENIKPTSFFPFPVCGEPGGREVSCSARVAGTCHVASLKGPSPATFRKWQCASAGVCSSSGCCQKIHRPKPQPQTAESRSRSGGVRGLGRACFLSFTRLPPPLTLPVAWQGERGTLWGLFKGALIILAQGPTPVTSFTLHYFLGAPISRRPHWALSLQHWNLGVHRYLVLTLPHGVLVKIKWVSTC